MHVIVKKVSLEDFADENFVPNPPNFVGTAKILYIFKWRARNNKIGTL